MVCRVVVEKPCAMARRSAKILGTGAQLEHLHIAVSLFFLFFELAAFFPCGTDWGLGPSLRRANRPLRAPGALFSAQAGVAVRPGCWLEPQAGKRAVLLTPGPGRHPKSGTCPTCSPPEKRFFFWESPLPPVCSPPPRPKPVQVAR